jgi:dihydrodipicolinate synthase/N-acetylneuraminate lyase
MARAARQLELSGVFADAITPHRAGAQDPDFSASLDLLDFLAGAGVRGICIAGPTGEFIDYNFFERQRLVYLGTKRSRVPLIAGVSHSTLAGALQIADEAIAAGADGLLLMPPYFFDYPQSEIEEFFARFAAETRDAVPFLLHNAPQITSRLEIETVARLIHTGFFAGILDSSGDWPYFARLLALKRERRLAVFAGHDRIAARALEEGADGLITASACAVPELVVKLAKSISTGNAIAASTLNTCLLEFAEWMEKFPVPAGIKRAVELRGQKSGAPLIPLAPETRLKLAEFSSWFSNWLPGILKVAANA